MPSFPYTTTSPPPTAGPLPVIERANLNTPYAAGGGGGGGSGPNLVVSTITFPDGTITTDGAIFSLGNQSTLTLSSDGSTFLGLKPTLNALLSEGGLSGVSVGANLIAGGIGLIGQGGVFNTQTPAFINGNGTGSVMVSSILVSSINGAAPAGGGVNPAGISTAQVAATASTLTLAANGQSVITLDDTKTIAIELLSKSGAGSIRLNGYSTIVTGDLNVSSINGAAPGGSNFTTASISTATISSLNGLNASQLTTSNNYAITGINIGSKAVPNVIPANGRASYVGNAFGKQQNVSFYFPLPSTTVGQLNIVQAGGPETWAWNEVPNIMLASEPNNVSTMNPIGISISMSGDPGAANQIMSFTYDLLSTPTRVEIPSSIRCAMTGYGY